MGGGPGAGRDDVKIGKNGYVFLLDSQGVLLSHPDEEKILNFNIAKLDFGRKILAGEDGLIAAPPEMEIPRLPGAG